MYTSSPLPPWEHMTPSSTQESAGCEFTAAGMTVP